MRWPAHKVGPWNKEGPGELFNMCPSHVKTLLELIGRCRIYISYMSVHIYICVYIYMMKVQRERECVYT